jgi:hypothetical protein
MEEVVVCHLRDITDWFIAHPKESVFIVRNGEKREVKTYAEALDFFYKDAAKH